MQVTVDYGAVFYGAMSAGRLDPDNFQTGGKRELEQIEAFNVKENMLISGARSKGLKLVHACGSMMGGS